MVQALLAGSRSVWRRAQRQTAAYGCSYALLTLGALGVFPALAWHGHLADVVDARRVDEVTALEVGLAAATWRRRRRRWWRRPAAPTELICGIAVHAAGTHEGTVATDTLAAVAVAPAAPGRCAWNAITLDADRAAGVGLVLGIPKPLRAGEITGATRADATGARDSAHGATTGYAANSATARDSANRAAARNAANRAAACDAANCAAARAAADRATSAASRKGSGTGAIAAARRVAAARGAPAVLFHRAAAGDDRQGAKPDRVSHVGALERIACQHRGGEGPRFFRRCGTWRGPQGWHNWGKWHTASERCVPNRPSWARADSQVGAATGRGLVRSGGRCSRRSASSSSRKPLESGS